MNVIVRIETRRLFETKYSRMDQVKFFKVCLPQILLGPFLNTLTHILEELISREKVKQFDMIEAIDLIKLQGYYLL